MQDDYKAVKGVRVLPGQARRRAGRRGGGEETSWLQWLPAQRLTNFSFSGVSYQQK